MVSAKNSPNVPEVGENYLLHCRWSLEEERGEKDLQAPCIAVCNHIQHDKSHLEKMFKTAISNVTKKYYLAKEINVKFNLARPPNEKCNSKKAN